eukprot:8016471-Alexandrium_andersonii.AAC.1
MRRPDLPLPPPLHHRPEECQELAGPTATAPFHIKFMCARGDATNSNVHQNMKVCPAFRHSPSPLFNIFRRGWGVR